MKYHINKNGQAVKCNAKTGSCPLDGEHFDSQQEAEKYIEAQFENQYGILNSFEKRKNEYALLIEEYADETTYTDNIYEAIYIINDKMISGDFCDGSRCLDHGWLKFDNFSWEEILQYGTVIVPETQSYISDSANEELDNIGYMQLPLNDNHIVGYK